MTDVEAIKILLEYDNVLTPSNIFYFVFRFLGWGIIKLLEMLVNAAQGSLNQIMKAMNFFDSEVVGGIIDKIKPFAIVFLTISLLYIAYQLMLNKKFDRSKIPNNVIVAILIIFLLPTVMKSLGSITQETFKMFTNSDGTVASEVIASNVTDIYLFDKGDFKKKDIYPTNNVVKNDISKISPVEEIDRGKVSNKKVFENELTPAIDGSSGYELKRINGFFKIDSEYYRWDINFFNIISTLLITAVVLVFTMVKVVKLMIELAFSKIFIIGGALADLSYGQKTKQMLTHILSIYISIVSVGLTLNLYIVGTAWINNKTTGFASVIACLGAGFFVIDGPNLLEKIFGVDAGLSSGVRMLMGINSGLDIASKLGKGIGAAGELAKEIGKDAAVAGAGLAGFAKGMTSLEDDMNKSEDGINLEPQALPENEDIKALDDNNKSNEEMFNADNNNLESDLGNGSDVESLGTENELDLDKLDSIDKLEDLDNSNISSLEDDGIKARETKGMPVEDEASIASLDDDYKKNENIKANGFVNPSANKGTEESINNNIPTLEDDILQNPNMTSRNGFDNNSIAGENFTMSGSEFGSTLDNENGFNSKFDSNTSDVTKAENRDWQYGKNSSDDFRNTGSGFNESMNYGETEGNRGRVYDKPNYMDSNETRNIKDIISGAVSNKANDITNSELASKMKTSYKIGNNTSKDLNRYVGIKKDNFRNKIINEKNRRGL